MKTRISIKNYRIISIRLPRYWNLELPRENLKIANKIFNILIDFIKKNIKKFNYLHLIFYFTFETAMENQGA